MIFKPENDYGFRWGPLVVQRVCHDAKKFGYVLSVETDAGKQIEIRVSPKGTKIEVERNDPR
jgi:hypothetical protein